MGQVGPSVTVPHSQHSLFLFYSRMRILICKRSFDSGSYGFVALDLGLAGSLYSYLSHSAKFCGDRTLRIRVQANLEGEDCVGNPKKIVTTVLEYTCLRHQIPIIFLLCSFGSLFGVAIKVPLWELPQIRALNIDAKKYGSHDKDTQRLEAALYLREGDTDPMRLQAGQFWRRQVGFRHPKRRPDSFCKLGEAFIWNA